MFRDTGRVGAVDLSRGLVILSLAALALFPDLASFIPHRIVPLVAPALMALVAVGIGFGEGRRAERGLGFGGVPALQARASILTRGVVLLGIGVLATAAAVAYADTLVVFASQMLLVAACQRIRASRLVIVALIGSVAVPVLLVAAAHAAATWPEYARFLLPLSADSVATSVLLLSPATLVGLAAARARFSRVRGAFAMLAAGVVASILGYGTGIVGPALASDAGIALDAVGRPTGYAGPWLEAIVGGIGGPSPFLLGGSIGAGFTVLAVLLLAWPVLRLVLFPVVALGAIGVSVFVAAAITSGVPAIVGAMADVRTAQMVAIGALIAATLWRVFFRAGPLENLVEIAGRRMTAQVWTSPTTPRHDRQPSARRHPSVPHHDGRSAQRSTIVVRRSSGASISGR